MEPQTLSSLLTGPITGGSIAAHSVDNISKLDKPSFANTPFGRPPGSHSDEYLPAGFVTPTRNSLFRRPRQAHLKILKREEPDDLDDEEEEPKNTLSDSPKVKEPGTPIECRFCGKNFKKRSTFFVEHERMHTGERPLVCPNCSKSFSWRASLRNHLKTCKSAGQNDSAKSPLSFEELSQDSEGETDSEEYGQPEKKQRTSAELTDKADAEAPTINTADSPSLEKTYCSYCGRFCNTKEETLTHEKTHTSEEKYTCFMCSKPFCELAQVCDHMRMCKALRATAEHDKEGTAKEATVPEDTSAPDLPHGAQGWKSKAGNLFGDESALDLSISHALDENDMVPLDLSVASQAARSPSHHSAAKSPSHHSAARSPSHHSATSKNKECSYCGKYFRYKHNLVVHERIHTGERPYACTTCDKRFKTRSSAKQHEIRCAQNNKNLATTAHNPEIPTADTPGDVEDGPKVSPEAVTPLLDTLSRAKTLSPGPMSDEEVSATMSNKLECPICDKRIANQKNLQLHLNMHYGRKPYGCGRCDQRFNNPGSLAIHKKKCRGGRPSVKQPTESKRAISEPPPSGLSIAVTTETETRSENQRTEKDIPVAVETRSESSVVTERASTEEPKEVEVVGEAVPYLPFLTRFISSDMEITYHCNLCDKTGKNKTEVARHTTVHVGPNIYHCPHCDDSYPTLGEILAHERLHPDAEIDSADDTAAPRSKPASPAVRRDFSAVDAELVENPDDGGQRTWKCKICEKTFLHKTSARDHVMCHTGMKRHKCEDCDMSFNRPSELRAHAAATHPIEIPAS